MASQSERLRVSCDRALASLSALLRSLSVGPTPSDASTRSLHEGAATVALESPPVGPPASERLESFAIGGSKPDDEPIASSACLADKAPRPVEPRAGPVHLLASRIVPARSVWKSRPGAVVAAGVFGGAIVVVVIVFLLRQAYVP